jgi:glutathione S-transferase
MKPTITAFAQSPDRGRGLARDMRVRWALEEVGQPYDVRLLTFSELKEPAHIALNPFGSIPTYEEGDVRLFESGAIVLHIAHSHPGLLPTDARQRAGALSWAIAALSTIEPPLVNREMALRDERGEPWFDMRQGAVEARARKPLDELSRRLGDGEWLDRVFSVGDLLVIGVLFRAKPFSILDDYPSLADYVSRGEARPAFKRAFAAQLSVFKGQP